MSINFSVLIHAFKEETIFYLQNTQWHHQISHPFHLLLLLSVTPASMPCVMDFQMQVHDFFQDLTGIFLCVRDEDQDLSGSLQKVLLKDSAYRPEAFSLNLFEKDKCETHAAKQKQKCFTLL